MHYSAVAEKPCEASELERAVNEVLGDLPDSDTA